MLDSFPCTSPAEVSLFRQIDSIIKADDVFLADRAYSGWFDLTRLIQRGAHVVVRKHQARRTDSTYDKLVGRGCFPVTSSV